MRKVRFNTKAIKASIVQKTKAIIVGETYFLSSFHDQAGAMVKVISKSTKENSCGWPSSVEIEVVEAVNDATSLHMTKSYVPGYRTTCNASNLYVRREDASHKAKYPSFYKGK